MRLCVWSCLSCGALFNNLQTELFCLSKFFFVVWQDELSSQRQLNFCHPFLFAWLPSAHHTFFIALAFIHSFSILLIACWLRSATTLMNCTIFNFIKHFCCSVKTRRLRGKVSRNVYVVERWTNSLRLSLFAALVSFALSFVRSWDLCKFRLVKFLPSIKKKHQQHKRRNIETALLSASQKNKPGSAKKKRTPKADASNDAMETLMHALYSHYIPLHFSLSLALLCPSRTYALKYFSPRTTSFSRPPPYSLHVKWSRFPPARAEKWTLGIVSRAVKVSLRNRSDNLKKS